MNEARRARAHTRLRLPPRINYGGGGRRSKEHGGHKAGNGTGGGSFLDGRVRSCAGRGGGGLKGPRLVPKTFDRFASFSPWLLVRG